MPYAIATLRINSLSRGTQRKQYVGFGLVIFSYVNEKDYFLPNVRAQEMNCEHLISNFKLVEHLLYWFINLCICRDIIYLSYHTKTINGKKCTAHSLKISFIIRSGTCYIKYRLNISLNIMINLINIWQG